MKIKLIKITIVLFILIIIIVSVCFLPVKKCLIEYPLNSDESFIIVRHDSTKNWWIKTGDENGLFDWDTAPDTKVEIKGKNLENIISSDLYSNFAPNYFILWGDVTNHLEIDENGQNYSEYYYTIECENWDIYKEVYTQRNNLSTSKSYLTLLDYKWFDYFRFWNL